MKNLINTRLGAVYSMRTHIEHEHDNNIKSIKHSNKFLSTGRPKNQIWLFPIRIDYIAVAFFRLCKC